MKKYGKASGQISELNTAPVFPEILRSWYLLLKKVPSLSCAEWPVATAWGGGGTSAQPDSLWQNTCVFWTTAHSAGRNKLMSANFTKIKGHHSISNLK